MKLGLNVAVTSVMPDYGGSALVRFPLWIGQEAISVQRYNDLVALGIDPILVLDRNAFTPWGWSHQSPSGSMKMWGKLFPDAKYIECGNEPDGTGDESSRQTKADFVRFLSAARVQWPHAFIISGGLVAIDFSYLDMINSAPVNAIGFHPYAQDADSVVPLVGEIRSYTTKPLWATELGQPYDPAYEHDRASWLSNFLIALWQLDVKAACVYCGKQDQGEHGLILADDTPTESWAALTGAIPALAGDPPGPVPPHASVKWVGSPNYTEGRSGKHPVAIVLHTMDGSLGGTDGWFGNPASQVSAHYGVSLHGAIHQYVKTSNMAWANGLREKGNKWPSQYAGNPNDWTISIETEDLGDASQVVTDKEYNSVKQIVLQSISDYPSVIYLMGHEVISPRTRPNCPGSRWIASGRFAQLAVETGLRSIT